MKRLFVALSCAGLLAVASSCNLTDLLNFDYDINDPWGSWERMEPGIYECIDDSFGKGDVIAKGTDNSLIECNTDTSAPIPADFAAFDGTDKVYEFGYGEYDGNKYLHCTISKMSKERGATVVTAMTDIESTKKLWGARCSSIASFPSKYKKVHKGGSFMENYKWMCQQYQSLPFKAPEDQLVISYKEYGTKWSSERYPSAMDSEAWVIPYTGGGKFEYQEICRQMGWDGVGRRKVFYSGKCIWGQVDYVKACVSGLTYEEAAEYVAKVRTMAHYNKIIEDAADGSRMISFEVISDDEGMNMEGFAGYVYPGYKIVYNNLLTPTLTIEFSVCYMTYV